MWSARGLKEGIKAYERAIELSQKGVKAREISKVLGVHRETVRCWIKGIHKPWRNRVDYSKQFDLGYIAGAVLSDGSVCIESDGGNVYFGVRDKDFATLFAEAGAKIHSRPKPYAVWVDGKGLWRVGIRGKELCELLNDFHTLEKLSSNEDFARGFLRGYFDGDGHVGKSIEIGGEKHLIEFVAKLLMKFGINVNIRLRKEAGWVTRDGYVVKQDFWGFWISMRYLPMFCEKIGFGIKRKQEKLEKLVGIDIADENSRSHHSQGVLG